MTKILVSQPGNLFGSWMEAPEGAPFETVARCVRQFTESTPSCTATYNESRDEIIITDTRGLNPVSGILVTLDAIIGFEQQFSGYTTRAKTVDEVHEDLDTREGHADIG